jgi:hypothetical protein
MAVLGAEGLLMLQRQPPPPLVVSPEAAVPRVGALDIVDRNFWTGDKVTVRSDRGIFNKQSGPGCGMYFGGRYELAPSQSHQTGPSGKFYNPDPTHQMYDAEGTFDRSGQYWVHLDPLGRMSFYTSFERAMTGGEVGRVPVHKLDWEALIIAANGTSDYDNATAFCTNGIGPYAFSDIQSETTLESLCSNPSLPAGLNAYDNANLLPRTWLAGAWEALCDMKQWSLELSAPAVDVTGVGEEFGESVKNLVTAGGTIDFFVQTRLSETHADAMFLMQLLLMVDQGCEAKARFYLYQERPENTCFDARPGCLFYEATLILVRTAINVTTTDVIAGSLSFVTTGSVALRSGLDIDQPWNR